MNTAEAVLVHHTLYTCKHANCRKTIPADLYFRYHSYCPECAVKLAQINLSQKYRKQAKADQANIAGKSLLITWFVQGKHYHNAISDSATAKILSQCYLNLVPDNILITEPIYSLEFSATSISKPLMTKTMLLTCQAENAGYQQSLQANLVKFYFRQLHNVPGYNGAATMAIAYKKIQSPAIYKPIKYLQDTLLANYIDNAQQLKRNKYRLVHDKIQRLMAEKKYHTARTLCRQMRNLCPEYADFYLSAAECEAHLDKSKRGEYYYGLLGSKEKAKMCAALAQENAINFFQQDSEIELLEALKWYIRAGLVQLNSGYYYVPEAFTWLAQLCRQLGLQQGYLSCYELALQAQKNVKLKSISTIAINKTLLAQVNKAAWYLQYAMQPYALKTLQTFIDMIKVKQTN